MMRVLRESALAGPGSTFCPWLFVSSFSLPEAQDPHATS